MRLAVVNWRIRALSAESDFVRHATEFLDKAAQFSADWVLFPEFFTLELMSLEAFSSDPKLALTIRPEVLEPIFEAAKERGLALTAGSTFKGRKNVSISQSPAGARTEQEKLVLTQFELDDWNLEAGMGVQPTHDPRVRVAICYDSEFPECARAHAEDGGLLLLVPAFTETRHGFWRVRHSCHARAVENQIFVAHSSLCGSLGGEPVPTSTGSSAIIAPSVLPFPESGVLAETAFDEDDVVVADFDFEALLSARQTSDVRNWDDRSRGRWRIEP
jgi:predicted amidohydrolase